MNLKESTGKIVAWHYDRNLIEGATDDSQFKKLMSEFGELSDNLASGKCIKDDIGDMGIVIINIAERNHLTIKLLNNATTFYSVTYIDLLNEIQDLGDTICNESKKLYHVGIEECLIDSWESLKFFAKINDYDFEDCLEHAYNEIKDRKGKMINGTFVKESSL